MLANANSGILLFGITPPRRSTSPERVKEIADVTLARLAGLDLDGLILYDIDDESDRNPDERAPSRTCRRWTPPNFTRRRCLIGTDR